jgi:ketopantoate reductase
MRHAVLGAGGVGGLVGGALAKAGHPVILLSCDPAASTAIPSG